MLSLVSAIPGYASSGSGGSPTTTNSIIICTPNVQNPHNSTHKPGTVNEVVTVACTAPVTQIQLVAGLYYNSILVKQSPMQRCSNAASCQANTAMPCQNGDYTGGMSWGVYSPPGHEPPTSSNVEYGKTVTVSC
jgi:hypothetical protein